MTLTTTIALDYPVHSDVLWGLLRELVAVPDGVRDEDFSTDSMIHLRTPVNSGALATLTLLHGRMVPVRITEVPGDFHAPWDNIAWIVLSFDSTGEADDLHAWLVTEVFDWVSRGTPARMAWLNERNGQWNFDTVGVLMLGDPRRGATVRQELNG